jgi:predicted secreted hydrolase
MSGQGYNLDIILEAKKEPVWHCDNGKLKMGILDDPKQITYYFSFTNLVLNGKLNLDGVDHIVKGKAWYDKQGGTYSLTNYRTNWEWFSFRFFNDEELMLFYFPQSEYKDGTYIKENGDYQRINNYIIEPLGFILEEKTKYNFSYGWKITIPQLKGVEFTLKPKTHGQFNVFFYELIADVFDKNGDLIGYCFVELLPGARNKKINSLLAFKKK